jgi:hypothetical protein
VEELRLVAQSFCAAAGVSNGGVERRGQDEEPQGAGGDLFSPGLHAELPGGAVPEIVIEQAGAAVEAGYVSGVVDVQEDVA